MQRYDQLLSGLVMHHFKATFLICVSASVFLCVLYFFFYLYVSLSLSLSFSLVVCLLLFPLFSHALLVNHSSF